MSVGYIPTDMLPKNREREEILGKKDVQQEETITTTD
jgi:hypothetical protein